MVRPRRYNIARFKRYHIGHLCEQFGDKACHGICREIVLETVVNPELQRRVRSRHPLRQAVTIAGPIGANVCQLFPKKKPPGNPRAETSINCV